MRAPARRPPRQRTRGAAAGIGRPRRRRRWSRRSDGSGIAGRGWISGSRPKKTQRQPSSTVTAALIEGPISPGRTNAVEVIANTRGRSPVGRRGRPRRTHAGIAPPPTPWSTRQHHHPHRRRRARDARPAANSSEAACERQREPATVGEPARRRDPDQVTEQIRRGDPPVEREPVELLLNPRQRGRDRQRLEADHGHGQHQTERERAALAVEHRADEERNGGSRLMEEANGRSVIGGARRA